MRVVVCGLAPLPPEPAVQSPAPGARTWQLARALAADGHDVTLVLRRIPGAYREPPRGTRSRRVEGFEVLDAPWEEFVGDRWLRRVVRDLDPDAVVGASLHGAEDACRLGHRLPVWADLFGDPMAEAQAQAVRVGGNLPVVRRWRTLRRILERADRVSTVSRRQRLATLGELAAAGRLGRETAGEELVHVIPFGLDEPPPRLDRPVVRGSVVGDDDFVVLWSGSYNVWTDPETLFAGVDAAMRQDPRIRFVSTGGPVHGYDDHTYGRFVDLVDASARRDRFHLLGWVDRERAATLSYEADLGVVAERRLLEGELGTKTRIVEWMAAGLPVLASDVSELPSSLARAGRAFVVPPGDAGALERALVELAGDPRRLEQAREAARAFVTEELTLSATCGPLVRWARDPVRAGDRVAGTPGPAWTNRLPGKGGLPAVELSARERLVVLLDPLLRWSGLRRWWLRRRFRSLRQKEGESRVP